ncbi:helix-turn-helix domain-containing protein [Pantoea sp. NPDC088449]|jgi:transcriptional regulator with XRE-family HTH domain|uniref:helix-turn-helix domain-containing protein n=1 Tax=unclassified Pantoea TaxID=2630326 RepID=UPI001C9455B0|nr:helix-turn-helix transcriptional regulator [Pantoea sp. DY-5]MBY4841006.1 helix-turn-helix domain-containing protein [Pantoea sp. DY-5]
MSTAYGKKLRLIRIAEGLTQMQLRDLTGIGLSTIKNYETGREVGLSIIEKMCAHPRFQKYVLWLMTGETAIRAGQVAPKGAEDLNDEGDNADAANQ